jgi:hypothetical protein
MVAVSERFYWIAAFAIVAALVNSTGIIAIFQRRGGRNDRSRILCALLRGFLLRRR